MMQQRPVGYLTLGDYARIRDVTYQTAWNRYKAGKISGAIKVGNDVLASKDEFADIELIGELTPTADPNRMAIYARVSDPRAKDALDAQAKRVSDWALTAENEPV